MSPRLGFSILVTFLFFPAYFNFFIGAASGYSLGHSHEDKIYLVKSLKASHSLMSIPHIEYMAIPNAGNTGNSNGSLAYEETPKEINGRGVWSQMVGHTRKVFNVTAVTSALSRFGGGIWGRITG